MKEEIDRTAVSDVPGAKEAGIIWMMADGVHTKAEALWLAEVFVAEARNLRLAMELMD